MIDYRSFTKDWLQAVNKKLGWNRHETQLKNIEKAAAKTAYLVSVLLTDGKTLEKYDPEMDIGHLSIQDSMFLGFNEYKYSNPDAFYYWYKAVQENKST